MPPTSRRGILAALGASAAGLVPARAANPEAPEEGACLLTPQAIEGPFYLDPKLVRAEIAEGRPGVPLRMRLRVVEAGPCTPLANARVDIWHCDAKGLYSGYPGQGDAGTDTTGTSFCRGTQITDSGGWATFETIWPGWYPGRATHVHVKVILDARTMLTGQIYFPDAVSEFLYTQVPAYGGRRSARAVVNANDGIAREEDPNRRAFCAIKEERDRYLATLTLGVDRNARVTERDAGPGGRRGPPPGGPGMGPPRGGPGMGPPEPMRIKDRLAALVPGLKR